MAESKEKFLSWNGLKRFHSNLKDSVVNNLVSTSEDVPLSAAQGNLLSQKISKVGTDMNVLSSRMDTFEGLADGSTSNDAALADIAVGHNGKTYSSPGEAVRTQIGNLADDLTDAQKMLYTNEWKSTSNEDGLFTVSPGALRESDGGNMSDKYSNVRCVTPFMEPEGDALFVFDNTAYKYCIWWYSSKSVSSALYSSTGSEYISGGSSVVIKKEGEAKYIRIGFARVDKAELTTNSSDVTSDFYAIRHDMHIYFKDDTEQILTSELSSVKAELSGLKVGYDGTVYDTSSEAVNEQFSELSGGISYLRKTIYSQEWKSNINADGLFTVRNDAINGANGQNLTTGNYQSTRCSTMYMEPESDALFSFDDSTYRFTIWWYSEKSSSAGVRSLTDNGYILGGASRSVAITKQSDSEKYVRIGFFRVDGAELTTDLTDPDSDYSVIRKSMHIYFCDEPDSLLNESGKSADAKAVGDAIRFEKKAEGELFDIEQCVRGTVAGVSYEIGNGFIKLNGVANSNVRFKLSGTFTPTTSSAPASWADETIGNMEMGKRYLLKRVLVSGTDETSGTITTSIRDSNQTRILVENESSIITNDACYIQFYFSSGTEFADAVYAISLRECEDNDDSVSVPDYWKTHLDEIAEQIKIEDNSSGLNGDRFFFLTDYHQKYNLRKSPALIKYLSENLGINKLFFGGDITEGDMDSVLEDVNDILQAYKDFSCVEDIMYPIIGNHEYNNPGSASGRMSIMPTVEFLYRHFIKKYEKNFGSISSVGDYWIDNTPQKIRYFFLGCTYNSNLYSQTVSWVLEEFAKIPDNYTVVVISHIGLSWDNEEDTAIIRAGFTPVSLALDALAIKSSYTCTFNGTVYSADFSDKNVVVAGALTGHCHYDSSLTTDHGVPIISTTTDAYGKLVNVQNIRFVRVEKGTATEQAFDVVQIDKTTRTIKMTRVGGLPEDTERSRTFTY